MGELPKMTAFFQCRFLNSILETHFLGNILFISLVQELIILALVFLSFSQIKKVFQGIGKKTYLLLFALLGVQILIAVITNQPFMGFSEEWEGLYSAKLLAQGNIELFAVSFRHGTTWQVFLAQFFMLFGFKPGIASALNIFAAVAAAFAIFHLSYALFSSRTASVASTAVFILSPAVLRSTSVFKGKPMIVVCLAAVFLLCAVVSLRTNGWKMRTATLLVGAFLINLRQELGIYMVILLLGWAFLRNRKTCMPDEFKGWIVPVVAFIFFASIFYLHMGRGLSIFYGGHMGGALYIAQAQCGECFQSLAGWFPVFNNLGPAAFKIACAGRRLVIAFLYWFSGWGLFILPVFLVPFLRLKKEYSRQIIFLALAFLLHNMVYAIHTVDPEERFLVQIYPLFCAITGFGLSLILKALSPKNTRHLVYLLAVPALGLCWRNVAGLAHPQADYKALKQIDERLDTLNYSKPLLILVNNLNDKTKWKFLTDRQVVSFQDLAPEAERKIYLEKTLTWENAADYRLPMHIFEEKQIILVQSESFSQTVAQFLCSALKNQCDVRDLFEHNGVVVSSLGGCKREPDGNYHTDVRELIKLLNAHGMHLRQSPEN